MLNLLFINYIKKFDLFFPKAEHKCQYSEKRVVQSTEQEINVTHPPQFISECLRYSYGKAYLRITQQNIRHPYRISGWLLGTRRVMERTMGYPYMAYGYTDRISLWHI